MSTPSRRDLEYIEQLYRKLGPYQEPNRRLINRLFRGRKPAIHFILFFATVLTTFATAYILHGTVADGIWFSGGIMSILLAHEMGHYIMSRKYGVAATLPFFIPFPPMINPFGIPPIWNPFGTMGAVIKMEGRIPSRKALFDIGAGGPLAGLIIAIPVTYFGLMMSDTVALSTLPQGSPSFGESPFFKFLAWLAVGPREPGYDIVLHPLAYAGWAGLFFTALNLLPIGQLDGGHVVYALLGEKSKYVYPLAMSAFIIIALYKFIGWVPLILLLFLFRIEHPPTTDPVTRLDPARQLIAVAILIFFIFSFTPVPIRIDF